MAQTESRVKKTLLNARVNLIFYFLTLILSFFSRKIFLDCLGDDFIGLTGTLQNLLGFLNLAELGIGGAIGYLLYKPLFDHDEEKITEIISVMGYLYRWIGLIILGSGLILACFLPLIFPDRDTHLTLGIIYFAYFAFLGSSLIGYFINYRQNLLGADQRNYVVTGYFQTGNIIKVIIQMVLAFYTRNLYLWVAIEFIFGILYTIILNWKINLTYPWLKANAKLGSKIFKQYPEVMKKTWQLFIHKIAFFVQYQTTPILIYSFVSLSIVAFYGNYTTVTDKVRQLISSALGSASAGVGNLCAEGNIEKSLRIYREIFALFMFIAGSVGMAIYFTISPFISLWLGQEYVLPQSTILLFVIILFIGIQRGATDHFINAYGLFHDIWAPLTETAIFVVVAIIGGKFWGLNGILLGSVVSLLVIVEIWKPIFLFRKGFKISIYNYWKHLFVDLLPLAIAFILTSMLIKGYLNEISINWFKWIFFTSIITIFNIIVIYFLLLILEPGMKELTNRYLKLLKLKK